MNRIRKVVAIIFLSLLLILTACNKKPAVAQYKIPNLVNLNRDQIVAKFGEMDINITLDFKDFYEVDLPENTFWQFGEENKIGDVIEDGDTITIYLTQTKITLPNLAGINRDNMTAYFTEIGVPSNLIIYQANAFANVDNDTFVSYKDYSINQKHDFTEGPLTIVYKRDSTLPNLNGLNEQQITNLFQDLNIIVTLDFKYYFKTNGDNKFERYINHQVGDLVEAGSTVEIYIASQTINLPILRDLTRAEVETKLSELGIPSTHVTFRGEVNTVFGKNEFIRYGGGLAAGNEFTPTISNKIEIYYNISSEVPNLEGLNKLQITKALNDANISVIKFEYVLDNSKEYDLFADYGNKEVGDMIDPSDEILIYIYQNNDVNTSTNIAHTKQLFISKYIDGNNSNKGIELFNPTDEIINLSDFYLTILANGSFIPTYTIRLNGSMEPNETFVVVNSNANEALKNKADFMNENIFFDGNDTIQLRQSHNDTYIDSIYHVGNISATLNGEVFVRRSHITAGNRDFIQTDWFGFIPTYFDGIGIHPFDGDVGPAFTLIADKTFQQYGMTEVKLLSVADGDTIYVESLDPRDTTSYTGNQRLRFLMVDTPETNKPGVVGEPYANVATNFTKVLLQSATKIYIQSDPSAGLTETYGRHLALIWFRLESNITFMQLEDKDGNYPVITAGWHLLNYELVKMGLGEKNSGKVGQYQNSPIFSNRYLYSWGESALLYAQENKLGLHSGVHKD